MSEQPKLTGPDLALGIASSDLADGAMLLGHVNDEAVLLARRGVDVFAVGASCTHYGGPLAEGLFVGDEVRCPLHHACFSLRTGEPVRAPALNPIPCFDVASKNGKLVVLGKRAPAERVAHGGPSSVVIVGAGPAGNACAEALRREKYAGPITLLGAEGTGPVDRPNLSKDYLAGNAPEEWIPLRPDDFYKDQNIRLMTNARVTAIDLAQKRVTVEGGASHSYAALVLATGAEAARLTIPGADAPHVFVLRTLADSRAIIAMATRSKRAVVIGASFIGLETAASLRARGLEVHIVAPDAIPLARILGDEVGGLVKKLHEEHGVHFHLGTTPRAIEADAVVLTSGQRIAADMVVMGVGVRPVVSLAEQAGLKVDRGIVVDDQFRTSERGVWAVGDAARWLDRRSKESIRVEHWVVAERTGQIAAQSILSLNEPLPLVPFFWSVHYDLTIDYVGHAERWDRVDIAGSLDARDAAVAYRLGRRTLAVATIGRDRASLDAEAALERGDETALHEIVP